LDKNDSEHLCRVLPELLAPFRQLRRVHLIWGSFKVRYLKRGSWASRQELMDHLYASMSEYNRLFAHPINDWSWTRRDLREWIRWKTTGLG